MNAIDSCTSDPATKADLMGRAADLMSLALTMQGAGALVSTRRHAALHEAGHAVVAAVLGLRVHSVEVFRRGDAWLGFTNSGEPWQVGPATSPADDLIHACNLLAGPLAELVFSGKPALGAGIDEIATAQAIVGSTSHKLSTPPDELMMATTMGVIETLKRHRATLDAQADALMHRPKVKQVELARLLAPVRGIQPC